MNNISAAILAGGMGTRLRSAVGELPKCLAPVGGRPFITYLLDELEQAGIVRVTLLTGFGADKVQQTLGTNYGGLTLTYSREKSALGTGGAVRHALSHFEGSTLLLMNGDSFCDVDLQTFVANHRRRRADWSMVLASTPDASRFGQVEQAPDGRIIQFVEKPAHGRPGLINAGIYLIARSLLQEIPTDRPVSLEREVFPNWLAAHRGYGFAGGTRFLDIGTPSSYAEAEAFFGRRVETCSL